MVLCSIDNMIFWEKVEDAAQYVIHLLIESKICPEVSYSNGYRHVTRPQYTPKFLFNKHKSNTVGDAVNQEINVIYISREKTYYTFDDLVSIARNKSTNVVTGYNYYVFVEAEDRQGNLIDKSENVLMNF